MQTSARAQGILDQFARDQGVAPLRFDRDGLIPITLGPDLVVAIGYNAAVDAFFFFAVLDVEGGKAPGTAWWAFGENARLAERRTRLALEPSTDALTLAADLPVAALDYPAFADALDRFVRDCKDVRARIPSGDPRRPHRAVVAEPVGGDEFVTFRL